MTLELPTAALKRILGDVAAGRRGHGCVTRAANARWILASAASMIFSACRSALLFPAARGFCLDTQTIVRAICECVTKQDCIHARAGRDDVACSRLME
jgi:hypothetical protein